MKFPEEIVSMWRKRPGDWFVQGYERAAERVEERFGEQGEAYWLSPAEDTVALADEMVLINDSGSEETPDEARIRAFAILVLADLAEFAGSSSGERS